MQALALIVLKYTGYSKHKTGNLMCKTPATETVKRVYAYAVLSSIPRM